MMLSEYINLLEYELKHHGDASIYQVTEEGFQDVPVDIERDETITYDASSDTFNRKTNFYYF